MIDIGKHQTDKNFDIGKLYAPMGVVVVAMVVTVLVTQLCGFNSLQALLAMLIGAFSPARWSETLLRTTPLIFTGLAVAIPYQCGLFNIGAEGQLLMGGLVAALIGSTTSGIPKILHLPLALMGSIAAGGLFGVLPAILKQKLGAHEIITSMMLNYVALLFTSYLVNYPLKAEGVLPQTVVVNASSELTRITSSSQLSTSLLIAILLVVIMNVLLWNTPTGYEIRAVGHNPTACRMKGINVTQTVVVSMAIGGALAGIGGGGEVLGTYRRFIQAFSPGYGYDGIAVALLGRTHPIGVLLSALLLGALRSGGTYMEQSAGVPADFVSIIQGVIILVAAAQGVIALQRDQRRTFSKDDDIARGEW